MIDRLHRFARGHAVSGACLALVLAVAACKYTPPSPESPDGSVGTDGSVATDAATACNPANPAPTYTQLYTKYFAVGTPGHCAKSGCHSDPDHNVWLCGGSKDSCYQGMVTEGLIDKTNPLKSKIADPENSPLIWIDTKFGFMPQDKLTPLPAGRDDIIAWVGACAQNN